MSFYYLFIALALTFIAQNFYGQSPVPYTHKNLVLYADSLNVRPCATFTLLKDDYVKSSAFFCRQEWKLEKALKIPIRLRVGSLEQCNRLEGKLY